MCLEDSVALKLANTKFQALASISGHYRRAGYDHAGFTFNKRKDGIGLTFSGHEVAVMAPGFNRDDVLAMLRDSVERHVSEVVVLLRDRLEAELSFPSNYFLYFDREWDMPRILNTEVECLNFQLSKSMCRPEASVSFNLKAALVRVQVLGEVKVFGGASYLDLLNLAIEHFNLMYSGRESG